MVTTGGDPVMAREAKRIQHDLIGPKAGKPFKPMVRLSQPVADHVDFTGYAL